ncbi:MAG: alpha/beta fold hydrolase [Aquabacterium sp.]
MIHETRIDLPTNARGEQPFLHCRVAGPVGAPLLLFLHGFPEGPFIWDEVITHFSSTHRCVAPALRGYPGSYTPDDVKAYRAHEVVADLLALIRLQAATPDTPAAAVIGHDWGGAIAWTLASMAPQSLQHLLILNAPHTATFLRDLKHCPAQQAASAYMNDLRAPGAEEALSAHDHAGLLALIERFGAGGAVWRGWSAVGRAGRAPAGLLVCAAPCATSHIHADGPAELLPGLAPGAGPQRAGGAAPQR